MAAQKNVLAYTLTAIVCILVATFFIFGNAEKECDHTDAATDVAVDESAATDVETTSEAQTAAQEGVSPLVVADTETSVVDEPAE